MIAGALMLVGVLWRFHVVYAQRLKLNEFVRSGQNILLDLQYTSTVSFADAEAEQNEWTQEVRKWVGANMQHYAAHFEQSR